MIDIRQQIIEIPDILGFPDDDYLMFGHHWKTAGCIGDRGHGYVIAIQYGLVEGFFLFRQYGIFQQRSQAVYKEGLFPAQKINWLVLPGFYVSSDLFKRHGSIMHEMYLCKGKKTFHLLFSAMIFCTISSISASSPEGS